MKTLTFSIILAYGNLALAGWPNWRGEDGGGFAPDAKPPAKPSLESNLAWKAPLPGIGCSTPIVWKDRIVLTCGIDGKDGVIAFDLKGEEVWRHSFGKEAPVRHKQAGSGSNPSALTDGEKIFVYFKSGTLACLGMDGDEKWKKNLHEEYATNGLKWDLGTSPVFAGGHVVIALIHNEHPSYLIAFNKESGEEVWKTRREFEAPGQSADSYTTPIVAEVDGVETIVTLGSDTLTGHRASDGKELWFHRDLNPKQAHNWRAVASPVIVNGMVVVPFGRGDFMAGVEPGGTGDTTSSHRRWTRSKLGSDSCTPALARGWVYNMNDKGPRRGTVSCVDPKNGETIWQDRLPRSAAIYYASPLIAGGRIYAGRSDGMLFSARMTPEGMDDVSECELGDTLVASPIAVGSRLFVRTHGHLWCFE
ncbi:MAG: PQQ-binding-like beta-propeller repeat protein [Verrucomicrobiota bacterium]